MSASTSSQSFPASTPTVHTLSPTSASSPPTSSVTDEKTDASAYDYVAPPIPSTFRSSLSAWWKAKPVEDAAHAELHLYRATGYFQGATVNNAPLAQDFRQGKGLFQGLESVRSERLQGVQDSNNNNNNTSSLWPFRREREPERMTIGTRTAPDGKVGCIRYVDLGRSQDDDHPSSDSALARKAAFQQGTVGEGEGDVPQSKVTTTFHKGLSRLGLASEQPDSSPTTPLPPPPPPSGRKLNMLEIGHPYDPANPEAHEKEKKIVLLHGYGAGTAFFFQNLKSLAQIPNSRLYALDWLGMGRSSRPPFHIPSSLSKTTETRVNAAESFFVDSLEEWRQKAGLDKMVIVGHSLGGYLSLAYTLRYPQRVERLVLVSPVGIPRGSLDPESESKASSSSSTPTVAAVGKAESEIIDKEFNQPQAEISKNSGSLPPSSSSSSSSSSDVATPRSDGSGQVGDSNHAESPTSRSGQSARGERGSHDPPRLSKRTRNLFSFLWEQNVSPFGVLRSSLFFGPMLAGRYTSRRFGSLPDEELRSLHAYCQSIFLGKGSGEYCLAHLLAPGAYARSPMVDRVDGLKIPVSYLYGQHDWMDVKGGRESVRRLNLAGNRRATCFVVPSSGHHIYLDNPSGFDELVRRIIKGEVDDL
ncbi:alpha/beta-hydrolase [Violaceomyces palustris]|uniref:Alpha/beta-hydrolase n=1 Tax=Violaceomyces palustris TaxID=1673888 RepID=A0ACD0NSQ3_9BASI|nr:alpha/beta-hydrolase [Violaceomyces palustris]